MQLGLRAMLFRRLAHQYHNIMHRPWPGKRNDPNRMAQLMNAWQGHTEKGFKALVPRSPTVAGSGVSTRPLLHCADKLSATRLAPCCVYMSLLVDTLIRHFWVHLELEYELVLG